MDCIVHGVPNSWTWLSDFHFHCNRGWSPQLSLEGRRVLKSWGGSVLGHLGLLTGLTQKENKLHCLFMTAGSFTTRSKAPIKIRLPQKLGNRGAVSLDVYILKEWLPGPRERYPWVVKLARCFQKKFTFQRGREFTIFWKGNNLRKGRWGLGVRKKTA